MAIDVQSQLTQISLLLATGNAGKVREIRKLTDGLPIEWLSLADLARWEEPDEVGVTFVENAIIKAVAAWRQSGFASLADDSGLSVDALGGAPGVHSARFAGTARDDAANIELLLERLSGVEVGKRTAHFTCVMALVMGCDHPLWGGAMKVSATSSNFVPPWTCLESHPLLPDGTVAVITQGRVDGVILNETRGSGGFGYDPVFYYPPLNMTFAELSTEAKNRLSHRALALGHLLSWLGCALGSNGGG